MKALLIALQLLLVFIPQAHGEEPRDLLEQPTLEEVQDEIARRARITQLELQANRERYRAEAASRDKRLLAVISVAGIAALVIVGMILWYPVSVFLAWRKCKLAELNRRFEEATQ